MATIGPFAKKMKIKVSLNNIGLVIPVTTPKERVSKLFAEIAHRFEAFGVKPGELRVAELRTEDNFFLNPRDIIEEVIEDGSTLIALDYDTWLAHEEKNCATEWLQVLREDYEDEVPKWITVGLHKLNKVWVKFGTGWPRNAQTRKTLRLEIFDIDGLKYFSKDGPVLIGAQESGSDKKWTMEAHFLVQKGNAKGITDLLIDFSEEIQISVKSSSDKKPVIKTIGINITGTKITQGEIHTVQETSFNYDPSKYAALLPKTISTGPTLSDPPEEDSSNEEAKPEIIKSAPGEIPLEAVYEGLLEIDQGWGDKDGFPNYFFINLQMINRVTEDIAISKVHVDYFTKDNQWKAVDEAYLGYRGGYYNYSWSDKMNFTIGKKSQEDIAVKATFNIKQPNFTARRRAHNSLPSPLKFRVTFEDLDGKKIFIQLSHVNKSPPSLGTKASIAKDASYANPIFYAQCDDPKLEGRIFVMAGERDNQYEVKNNDTTIYLRPSSLTKIAYQATKAKAKEFPCTELTTKPHELTPINAYYLVDLDNQVVYGMKFVLETTTSKVESCFVIPKLPEDK